MNFCFVPHKYKFVYSQEPGSYFFFLIYSSFLFITWVFIHFSRYVPNTFSNLENLILLLGGNGDPQKDTQQQW